ncbi:heterokaryon incompatibility Het-C [Leucosporidium creatinivorum]|uniref:Heterokaryon incompatibility Het-C n=1 Tax=Leucosporidium creatinivorum TaxID=106004 RepID=A0A1Y2G770_9BASI|nr:heterokaryon incompatibility Het-C [Leucosporidium creatinivorum]
MSNRMGFSLPVLLVIACALCFLPGAYAFGAGNIPSFSFLEGKAFRHGDIEDTLAELIKKSGGILGRGSKFGGLDIKRVYFGNWLRDYSQAMDIAGLSKLSKQTIINLCMALGFLAHGYATGEFEVTDERLGVYLCTEHIDNPKGYASDQPGGDARKYDPRLRPPVDPRELEIDPATGMKNYIANENGTWDTSARLVRERIHQCIDAGRRARNGGSENDLYEAYRLLGTLLHTVEDFSAHSNWCELSLRRLGYSNVFCHVGDACIVQSPAGPCHPLVTGTFGGSDFIHSLLGEASDHISEASVSDLAKAMDGARSTDRGATDSIRDMLFQLPGETGGNLSREMQDVEGIRSRAAAGNANEMSPQELHAALWQVLTFRDNVVKGIEIGISKIPGLSSLVEKLTDSINRFVFTTLEPLMKPIMTQATGALQEGSSAVISNNDQYEVFNNPHSSDPTHSFLSKDHFVLILNEPAGKIATIVVSHTVKAIVKAWENTSINANDVAHEVLECFHHPNFYNDNSSVQREMGAYLKSWIEGQSPEDKAYILNALTKDSVRNGKNKRKGHEKDQIGHGCGGQYNSILSPEKVSSFAQQHVPGASSVFNAAHSAQNAFGSAQHYIGREGPQGQLFEALHSLSC